MNGKITQHLGSHFLSEKYDFDPFLNLVLTINIADNKYERNTKFQAIYN
jgi:hypothetical protein